MSGSSSDGSSSHDDVSSGSASSVGSSGEEGEEVVGNMVVGERDEERVAGLDAADCRGAGEADDLELWLVRAPRGFDMRALNKRKIEVDAEGRVQSADLRCLAETG